MEQNDGRALTDRAGHEPSRSTASRPDGDHPSRGWRISCVCCSGTGLVAVWSFGVKEPEECCGCDGSGQNWQYPDGMIARYYAGPFVGRDSNRNPEGGDGTAPSQGDESAAPEGIAR